MLVNVQVFNTEHCYDVMSLSVVSTLQIVADLVFVFATVVSHSFYIMLL